MSCLNIFKHADKISFTEAVHSVTSRKMSKKGLQKANTFGFGFIKTEKLFKLCELVQ